jgi:OOP family OmpA-OmpF porin
MKKRIMVLAALLATSAAHAHQQAHAYLGFAAGLSRLSVDCAGTTTCDNTGSGGKLVGGYNFGNGFGLEAGYVSFGKARATISTVSGTIKPTAFTVGGVFALPLSELWGLNFRLGAARVETKGTFSLNTLQAAESQTKTKPYAGVGVTYAHSPTIKLELALDTTQIELAGQKGTQRLAALGVTFAF